MSPAKIETWSGPGDVVIRPFSYPSSPIRTDAPGFYPYSWRAGEPTVVVELLTHDGPDRLIRVYQPFWFVDFAGRPWLIPEGTLCNGADIPRIFHSRLLIGHPLMGDYRRASVVHDFACQRLKLGDQNDPVHYRDPRAVHRTLYDACTVDSLTNWKRYAMWRSVDSFGPQGPTPPPSR